MYIIQEVECENETDPSNQHIYLLHTVCYNSAVYVLLMNTNLI